MTLESWKEEFYTDPQDCHDDLSAVRQAIRKYEGASPENLKKHDITLYAGELKYSKVPSAPMFYSGHCALCKLHLRMDNKVGAVCGACPLAKISNCNDDESAWSIFVSYSDPTKMLEALKIIEARLLNEEKENENCKISS